jgi:translation elongation factor EF-Tu-like GTPase
MVVAKGVGGAGILAPAGFLPTYWNQHAQVQVAPSEKKRNITIPARKDSNAPHRDHRSHVQPT